MTITEANQKCDARQAVAFTDVSFFLTWIKQNTRDDANIDARFI